MKGHIKTKSSNKSILLTAAVFTVSICACPLASAQDKNKNKQATQQGKQENVVELKNWDRQNIDSGWSAEEIMDTEVFGTGGEEIGSVENLLINEQGKVVAVVAQVGGVWDIGDTHVAVPWKDVQLKNENIILPLTEENVGEYSLFDAEYFTQYDVGKITTVDDDVATGPSIWKATSLLDDYVLLQNNIGYGYVDDLIFDDKGQLQSVIINATNPDYDYGYFAYPWYGYGYTGYAWNPGLDYYVLPYNDEDLAILY